MIALLFKNLNAPSKIWSVFSSISPVVLLKDLWLSKLFKILIKQNTESQSNNIKVYLPNNHSMTFCFKTYTVINNM